jgi:hypothetical protein
MAGQDPKGIIHIKSKFKKYKRLYHISTGILRTLFEWQDGSLMKENMYISTSSPNKLNLEKNMLTSFFKFWD